jgi:trans-aconitate 2-methyltransferase
MLTAALQEFPEEKWVQGDIATWQAKTPFDLVFSNAALQWVPDHTALFPRLFSSVGEGGALAVQMPANNDTPLRQIAFEVADNVSWRHLMQPALTALTEENPSLYYDALRPLASRLDIWRTEYIHVMDSPRAIVDWYRGTGLRPFLEALKSDAQRESFLKLLLSEYTRAFPRQRDGKVLFPFWRLFVVAYK